MDPILLLQIKYLAISFALAFLVETLVEAIFGIPMDKVPKLQPYKWCLMYIAMICGVLLVFFYKVDLIALLQAIIPGETLIITPVGMLLTGLAIGRGSNYLHQFVSRFFPSAKEITDPFALPPVK